MSIAKRNEQHAGTMKPEFGSLQPAKGWEPGVQPSWGARPSRLDHMQILIWTVKAILGWVLLGWVFQIILICPRHKCYCLSIWLRLRELLALLLEPGMPSSLFSNSPVNLSKIDGVMSGWHLRGWGQCFTSGQTSNTQKKGTSFFFFVLLRNNQLFSKQIWVGFGGLSLSSTEHEAWGEAALLELYCSFTLQQLCTQTHIWAGLPGNVHWTCVVLFFSSLLTLHPRVANKIVLSMEV